LRELQMRRWSTGALARIFRIRQQRVMAIIALKQLERDAAAAGEPVHHELSEYFEAAWQAFGDVGVGERHVRLLPAYPAWEVRPGRPRWSGGGVTGMLQA